MIKAAPAPSFAPHVNAKRMGVFETAVMVATLENSEDIRSGLEAAIRAHHASAPGVKRSNEGGWHSETDLLTWGGGAARALAEAAIGIAQRMSGFVEGTPADFDWPVCAWANVSPPGALNNLHAHPGNAWAAVYYVTTGAAKGEKAGALYLEDPRFPMNAMHVPALRALGADGKPQSSQIELHPRAGDLIVFPAWLRHGVRVHRGSSDRISVALNIDVRAKRRS
jgi:uncharacterized protein (TIGR02466 family)